MEPLEIMLAALDETLLFWEPEDAVSRFAASLRRNLAKHMGVNPDE
jgi:hypothetical protein